MKTDQSYTDNNFTVLRLVLALMVVLGHFQLLRGVHHPPWPFNYAAMAVDCFFVASGYLVSSSFDRDSDLGRFYIRRFFRIYPLYIAVVAAQTAIFAVLVPGGAWQNLKSLGSYFVANAAFANFLQYDVGSGVLHGMVNPALNPSLWTLKIEFGFYLLLPFLWRATERWGVKVLVGVFVLSAAYYVGLNSADNYLLAKQLPGELQFFVLGIAAYRYRGHVKLGPRWGLIATIALALLCTALLQTLTPVVYPLAVGALVVAAALTAPRIRMKRDISYGVYLLHGPIIQLSLLFGIYRADWIGLAATLLAVILLACGVERIIEVPGIALGRKLSRRVGSEKAMPRRAQPASLHVLPSAAPPRASSAAAASGLVVVVLNDFCHVQGGASKVAIDEAVGLARSGVTVIFLGAVGPVSPELRHPLLTVECLEQNELIDFTRHPGVAFQGLWNLKAARHMRALLRQLPRDRTVVHLHGYTKALTTSPVRIAKQMGVPVVCTLHDFFAACPNGAFFDYGRETPCSKRALSARCVATQCDKRRYAHKLFRVVRTLVQRHGGRFPGAIEHYISLSTRSGAVLSPYLPRTAQVHRLPNITDVAVQAPIAPAENRTLLYVGRLDPEKGVRLLAETAGRLGLRVVFVGDGPLRPLIEAIPGLSVTGWLPREEVWQQLAQARCLVFPSLWYETYGLTVTEAASRGIPAIVSDVSAAAERIEEGVTGWRFRSGDAADLARCLELVAEDAAVAAAGAAAYRAFWRSAETWDAHAEKLIKIYNTTLQQGEAV